MDVLLPSGWEDWVLEDVIGEGAYGIVYRASRKIGDHVIRSAIKIIRIPSSEAEVAASIWELGSKESARSYYHDIVDTFLSEIHTMNALRGITNVVSVEDCAVVTHENEIGWTIFIRMELLTSFLDYSQTHSLTEADVIRLGMDICTALTYCEKAKIIHRDIKPSNIFVSDLGHFKLGDFGVARKLDRTSGVFSSKGTFPFMAPEVFHNEPYDHRVDIYSLGLVLYRLLNRNREPFVDMDKQIVYLRDREQATARRMQGEHLPPPVDASPAMSKVILKACDPSPDQRYSTADEFREALEHIKNTDSDGSGNHGSPWRLILCVAGGILLLALGIFLLIRNEGDLSAGKSAREEDAPVAYASGTVETESRQSIVHVNLNGVRMTPLMIENRLYSLSPSILFSNVCEAFADAGILLTEEQSIELRNTIMSQFVIVADYPLKEDTEFMEGDTVQIVFQPDPEFEQSIRELGVSLYYEPTSFVVRKQADTGKLEFTAADEQAVK